MPKEISYEVYKKNQDFYDNLSKGVDKSLEIKASIKLISGCQDNQLSYEGFGLGRFTEALQKVWANGRFNKGYSVFHQEIVNHLPAYQTPNYFNIGKLNTDFDNQIPFTI